MLQNLRTTQNTHLERIASSSVIVVFRDVQNVFMQPIKTAENFVVGTEDDFVRAGDVDSHPVVREAFGWMEIKHEEQTRTVEGDDFVFFVFPTDVTLQIQQNFVKLETRIHRFT